MKRFLCAWTAGLLLAAVPASAWDTLLVLTTDYSTYGGATAMSRSAPWTAEIDAATVSGDAVARWHDGMYYVVNRSDANIQILDPAQGLATVRQFSVGSGRNPQDIAFAPDGRAFVDCYDAALLLEVDVDAGTVVDSWSTAAFADADGLPETGWMVMDGATLVITCQLLDENHWWEPTAPGRLLLFDTTTDSWIDGDASTPQIDGIPLAGWNPAPMPTRIPGGGGLLVPTVGTFATIDTAGFEIVDLAARASSGLLVTEQQLGGEVIDAVALDATHGWAATGDAAFGTHVVRFDPSGAGPVTHLLDTGPNEYDYVDVAFDGVDLIYLGDRSAGAAGVRVFDAWSGSELTVSPVGVGRPPFMTVLPVVDASTAAPGRLPAAGLRVASPWPNPANPRTRFAARAAPGETVSFSVIDLRGRRLREWRVVAGQTGEAAVDFDGTDGAGRPLASGAYRLRAAAAGAVASRLFTLAR